MQAVPQPPVEGSPVEEAPAATKEAAETGKPERKADDEVMQA